MIDGNDKRCIESKDDYLYAPFTCVFEQFSPFVILK